MFRLYRYDKKSYMSIEHRLWPWFFRILTCLLQGRSFMQQSGLEMSMQCKNCWRAVLKLVWSDEQTAKDVEKLFLEGLWLHSQPTLLRCFCWVINMNRVNHAELASIDDRVSATFGTELSEVKSILSIPSIIRHQPHFEQNRLVLKDVNAADVHGVAWINLAKHSTCRFILTWRAFPKVTPLMLAVELMPRSQEYSQMVDCLLTQGPCFFSVGFWENPMRIIEFWIGLHKFWRLPNKNQWFSEFAHHLLLSRCTAEATIECWLVTFRWGDVYHDHHDQLFEWVSLCS